MVRVYISQELEALDIAQVAGQVKKGDDVTAM